MEIDEGGAQIAADVVLAEEVGAVSPSVSATCAEDTMRLLARTCRTLCVAGNELVPQAFWGRPEAAMTAVLMGRELGLGDMISLQRIHVIHGRPTLAAELIRGLIWRSGHRLVYLDRTAERCTIQGVRADTGSELTVTWTLDDAERAGLLKNATWRSYPRAMLDARATTELARSLFSDCVGWAVYAPEDFDRHD